ncbi:Nuclease (SNase domain-containing protein) [Hyella patelloides LEGE 07179]|uniref:Nuclease (SNase domain-containing protein) n=1 Tax=Hyella patelloides LEGE 07179 TaxID=945734 RepID=A0A563VTE8_9CYAN|nr:thermonuclease family protein [Hyella patelloides]VEP14746.1 Nuclease (SNase domain-containing protein) [Hyella patelloides LEGE 07179]
MNFKTFINGAALLIGLGLIGYSQFNKRSPSTNSTTVEPKKLDVWSVKPGSIYDGDTLRVVKGNQELKIRFCGIDAPELKQTLGVEARDYLRSLIDKSNGTVHLIRVGIDRYGRTIAELFVPLKSNSEQEIHLNSAMIEAGMAWHYERYSDNCLDKEGLAIAENLARDNKVGVHSRRYQKPWNWRKFQK